MDNKRNNNRRVRRRGLKPMFRKRERSTLSILMLVCTCVLIFLFGRVIYLNVTKGEEYAVNVLAQQGQTEEDIPYKRGDILDRNGNVLATSIMVYDVIIDCKILNEEMADDAELINNASMAIAKCFGGDADKIKRKIEKNKTKSYWVYKKNVTYDHVRAFNDIKKEKGIDGVWFETKYKRKYPYNKLACKVLGFSYKTLDGDGADIGIEGSYNDYLNGVNGRKYGYMDSQDIFQNVVKEPTDGNNVVSCIDMNIQRVVEKSIAKYMKKYSPKRIACVIADPHNGEILAMADDKVFDLNDPTNLDDYYSKIEQEEMTEKEQSTALNSIWNNFCITDSFEPGSTAKPFTVAAAFEEKLINENSMFFCDGVQSVGGFKIHCHDVSGHGRINVKTAVAESCNDTMMAIGAKIGAKKFAQYQNRFGFGTKTGIDLPNETRGLVYEADEIGSATLATNSFGQNFTVNMIQMTSGFASLINGGNYYEPRVVKKVTTEQGDLVKNYSRNLIKQTVTDDTSSYIKSCLREVVLTGTGSTAAMPGYTVGGKTGTAEKVKENGRGRIKGQYILSFIGCVPCENPQVICYTIMDSPKENTQATAFNTELWRDIMGQVLPYMGIEKTEKIEKKAKKKKLIKEFYENGIIEGDDGKLIVKKKKR